MPNGELFRSSMANYIMGYGTDQYIWQYENELGLPWESTENYERMSYPFLMADRIVTLSFGGLPRA